MIYVTYFYSIVEVMQQSVVIYKTKNKYRLKLQFYRDPMRFNFNGVTETNDNHYM